MESSTCSVMSRCAITPVFLKQPIRQRALAVVNVCDDAKIADCRLIFCHNILLPIDPYIAYRIPNIA